MKTAKKRLKKVNAALRPDNANQPDMPSIVRKLLIFAAVDGLILQPAPPRSHKPATEQAIKVDYKGGSTIAPLLKDRRDEEHKPEGLEVFGIIGLLKVATTSFLIAISNREEVAAIRGRPIYVITDVALIPLSSRADAEQAINVARETVRRRTGSYNDASDSDESAIEDDADDVSLTEEQSLPGTPPPEPVPPTKSSNSSDSRIAEDVIRNKGMYGRFVQRYFSKKGWSDENRRKQGLSSPEDLKKGAKNPEEESAPENIQASSEPVGESAKKVDELPADTQPEEVPAALSGPTDGTTLRLLPKILRTTKLYLASKNFYYSYDYDISRSLGRQIDIQSTPLHKSFDPLFFWNQSLIQPFVQAGQVNFVVPVMQGYVSQREFVLTIGNEEGDASITDATSSAKETVARQDIELTNLKVIAEEQGERRFLLTLISRRSVARAGLRYLRRGVDDEGNVANSVESEQLLSSQSWDPSRKVYSFLQYRGSIPVFFSQSPYSFKPIPAFYGSEETNATAFKKHFEKLASRYGNVHSVSLVEKQGTESSVGEAFQRHASLLNSRGGVDGKGAQYLGFRWFDFHHVCRGMKFENVSILIDLIASTLDEFSWTVEQNGALVSTQTGVLRTNCMDCLDRTNVVQSAAAREMLEKQLAAEKCYIDLIRDPKTAWFNVMWADNGDAISRQYAGTAALKGDFTRTRKRHITGALTDFSLTLTRYYNNIVNDYFTQAVIDFLLGRATVQIFEEFEADMNAKDYAVDLRRVRQNAVETCEKIVIEDQNEDMITAWTLSAPAKSDSLRAEPFEECVLILTQQALYFCRFDWTTEKVREFERVELERVKAIVKGTYITSILGERHMDEQRNVGLKISYTTAEPGKGIIRTNTRSLANEIAADEVPTEQSPAAEASAATTTANKDEEPQPSVPESPNTEARFWAFKALPPNSAIAYGSEDNEAQQAPTEIEMIKTVCDEIKKAVDVANRDEGQVINVQDQDIISLAEARKSTTYLESIGYSLKKLVWS